MSDLDNPGGPESPGTGSNASPDRPAALKSDASFALFFMAMILGFLVTWGLAVLGDVTGSRLITLTARSLINFGVCDDRLFQGDWWRAVTCLFMHAGLGHIFNNMLLLVPLAVLLRRWASGQWWLAAFFITGIAGSLLELLIHPQVALVGASGGIAGLLGAALVSAWRRFRSGQRVLTSLLVLAVLGYLLYSQLLGAIVAPAARVAHMAHLGGLLAGAVMGAWLPLRGLSPSKPTA